MIASGSDTVRQQVRLDAAPTGVVFGHGAVWVTNAHADTVSYLRTTRRAGTTAEPT